jgi:hypothetical protein
MIFVGSMRCDALPLKRGQGGVGSHLKRSTPEWPALSNALSSWHPNVEP